MQSQSVAGGSGPQRQPVVGGRRRVECTETLVRGSRLVGCAEVTCGWRETSGLVEGNYWGAR